MGASLGSCQVEFGPSRAAPSRRKSASRLRPWIGHREGTFGSLKSLLDRLGASRRQQHVPLTRVRPHPDAQARIQPFVRDLAVELLGEKLYDARTQSTWIDVALKADPVVGRR